MSTIEELGNIDKNVPLSVYKQQIQAKGSKANGGKLPEHDKMMTTYSICLHLLGKNLANLKYFKESKAFLQRAQYVASHLTAQPKDDLVKAIANDVQNLYKNFNKSIPDRNIIGGGDHMPTISETDSALQTIKTNLANHNYSLAADFEEQKALLDQLIKKEDNKANEKGRYDDKALEYVKQFIEEKKRKEKGAIDEYRAKIAKDFDEKQNEFQEKQQKVKKQIANKNDKDQSLVKRFGYIKKKAENDTSVERGSGGETGGPAGTLPLGKKNPRGNLSRSAGIPEQAVKAGDFDAEEKKTRIKKSEKNLAAEGAKLDNLALKYSSEKGKKQFFHKRRVNIEKVNEKLGYFGGGLLDPHEEEQVTLHGGQASSPERENEFRFEGNPFEDENLAANANNATIKSKSSPKKGQPEKSPVKLPPVRGYKLDTFGFDDLGESVMKKSMDAGYGSDLQFKGGYKNPHTRRLLQSMDNKHYGKFTKPKSFKSDTEGEKPKLAQAAVTSESAKILPKTIRDIPTYKPPQKEESKSDWRQDFKRGEDSEEELPDTKQVIEKLKKGTGTKSFQQTDKTIFDEDDEDNRDDPFFNDDINARDLDVLKTSVSKSAASLTPLLPVIKQQSTPQEPPKPPKSKPTVKTTGSDQGSARLPQINKRFHEDKKSPSPEKGSVSPEKRSPKADSPVKAGSSPLTAKNAKDTTPEKKKGVVSARQSLASKNKKEDTTPKEEDTKRSYVPPNKRLTKTQKAKLEEEEKAKKDKDLSKKKKREMDTEEGTQMKRNFDSDRLAQLATPKSAQGSKPESKEEKRQKGGDEKVKEIAEKVSRGKPMDFMSYLDRDVPAIDNKVKKKLAKNESDIEDKKTKDFDTKMNNKDGLFTSIKEAAASINGGSHSDRKSGRNSKRGGSQKQANEGTQDQGQDNSAQKGREGGGLLAGLELQRNGGLTIQGLRMIEGRAATTIQRFMRGYFTKKWYMNYMMRRRLGVPFSGMEFATNVFIRQFNKPNQGLQSAALQAPQLIEVLQETGGSKNMVKKTFRHGGKQSDISGDEGKSPGPKRLKKGMTPQQLMNDLQRDFLAKGLDAYNQFKRHGVDALTDDNGNPKYNEDGRPLGMVGRPEDDPLELLQLKNLSPRTVNVALDPLERMIPKWRGQNQERFLEVKEVGDYLDRVTRVREYEEKQKEIMKTQQYQQQAKQFRKHDVTTMASFAKAQGVFNRNPNKRNNQEDDEDYDPLDPKRQQDIPGGGPPGDDGDGSGGGSGGEDDDKKKKKIGKMIRNLPYKEEDGSIPLKMYQQFSREQIVFYKRSGNIPMKWVIQAGLPFVKDRKAYIPIRIFGELQNSRNMIVVYVMNLELMKISADYYQYNTQNFETIWPFILYLFNNWVRYQVKMIEVTKDRPLFGADEFMMPVEGADLKQLALIAEIEPDIHQNDYTLFQNAGQITGIGGEPLEDALDLVDGIKQARENYDDKLNFSSEIEYDDRFDLEQYKTVVRPDELVDRANPMSKRIKPIEIFMGNRKQLFNAYRMQLKEDRKAKNELDVAALMGGEGADPESEKYKEKLLYKIKEEEENKDYDKYGRPNKKVKLKLDEIYEPIAIGNMNPFAKFLELHFVPLPGTTTGQFKLMKALSQNNYNERQNNNVQLSKEGVALMNEERRRRLGLLPLTVTDYNCIDRAALKIKIIIDCLYPRRQMNGWALVPRDVREAYIDAEWQRRKLKNIKVISKLSQFSMELIKAFGEHIMYSKAYNEHQLMIEKSVQKVEDYKNRKQLDSIIQLTINKENRENRKSIIFKRGGEPGTIPAQDASPKDRSPKSGLGSEQALMLSTLRDGKQIDDPSSIHDTILKRGLVESAKQDPKHSTGLLAATASPSFHPLEAEPEQQENQYRDEHEMPMEIPGFNDAGKDPDIQDFIRNNEIFEQGIIRIKGNLYIAALIFKRIESNYENMKSLIEERIKVHAPKSLSHQVEMQKTYKGHLRMRSKLCDFVSTHKDVLKYDADTYRLIRPTEKLMLESEMSTKQKTKYKTYLEIKICTKMADSIWDDSFNLQWERIDEFYKVFGLQWRLHDLILKKKLSYRDRFIFFNFFGMTLSIRDTLLSYDLAGIDLDTFKYHNIFLKLDQLTAMRSMFGHMPYYFDDMIGPGTGFDECKFDRSISPFYNIDLAQVKIKEKLRIAQREGIVFEAAELHPDRAVLFKEIDEPEEEDDEAAIQGIHVTRYEERKKPELLVDEATKEYLMGNHDKHNMFNLTLTNFPQSDGLFLGRVQLGNPDTYRTAFNLRLDYFSVGFLPTLQIKAYNAIQAEAFELKVYHKPTIKAFIRICNLSNASMIVNQLQSAITVGRKITGRYVRLNFSKHNLYLSSGIGTLHGQDFINMAICNENLIRTMLNDNYRQFSGVMFFDNLGGRNLVTVSEFEIDMYQQLVGYQAMVHMNKHLSLDDKKNDKNKMKFDDDKAHSRRYQKVKLWKINLFNMADSKTYETVISYDDLHNYYETEFAFKVQQNLRKPDLIRLLSDYLRTLYIYRSKVGNLLYWRLPMYKRPLDMNTGLAIDVPPEHMYKLRMLAIYHALQRKIDGQNKHDDMASVVPVTMDQLKAKRSKQEPPSLSLRPKLASEKELPIYEEKQALRVLKVTSSIIEVLNTRPKLFRLSPTSRPQMALITILLHPIMECWLWQLYFPTTQRTYTAIFYPSDLFNMNTDIYSKTNKKNKNASIWIEMIKRSELQKNNTGDIILVIDQFKEPIKEILFQDHVYNDNALDIFFMEVVLKPHNNFVTEINQAFQPVDSTGSRLNEYLIQIRAFSLTRNVWIKDQMPLYELIKILKQENYMMSGLKLLYFSMVRDAAAMLAHKIIFSEEAKTSEVKKKALTYDIRDLQTSAEQMERLKKQHMKDMKRKHTNRDGMTEAEQNGLKTEWRNLIDLNKIFYQAVIAQSPTQVCTITYSDVKELFIYRLYRASDQSSYEKRIPALEVARTCAPHYQHMLRNRMFRQLGERIAKYYQKDMLVASLMTYYRIQQEKDMERNRILIELAEKYKPFEK